MRPSLLHFNDSDEPKLHAASGLTRNFEPKPAYHAVAWMLGSLADHRFGRALRNSADEGYLYEFVPEEPGPPHILAAWHATGDERAIGYDLGDAAVLKAELMPLEAGPPPALDPGAGAGTGKITAGVRPRLFWIKKGPGT